MSGIHVLEAIVGLIAVVVAVTAVARRFGLLTPILLVVVGLGLSFVPGFPIPRLDQQLVVVAILPPLLYSSAFFTGLRDLRANLRDTHEKDESGRCHRLSVPGYGGSPLPSWAGARAIVT